MVHSPLSLTLVAADGDVCFPPGHLGRMPSWQALDSCPICALSRPLRRVLTGAADGLRRHGRPAARVFSHRPSRANMAWRPHNAPAPTPVVNVIGDACLGPQGIRCAAGFGLESLTWLLHVWSLTSPDPMAWGRYASQRADPARHAPAVPDCQRSFIVVPADVPWGDAWRVGRPSPQPPAPPFVEGRTDRPIFRAVLTSGEPTALRLARDDRSDC